MTACVTDLCTSFLDKVVQTFLPEQLVTFLNTNLIRIPYFILNLWSIVHVIAGMLFFFVWNKYSTNHKLGFWIWLAFNAIFELFEYNAAKAGLYQELFVEELVDIITDLAYNQLGYYIAWKWKRA